jgi:hypothetical protein
MISYIWLGYMIIAATFKGPYIMPQQNFWCKYSQTLQE